jgi:hypothetical protein
LLAQRWGHEIISEEHVAARTAQYKFDVAVEVIVLDAQSVSERWQLKAHQRRASVDHMHVEFWVASGEIVWNAE